MSPEEKQYFDGQFSYLDGKVKDLNKDVQTIKRGVYGDEENDVLGLIQTDRMQHKRIKSLEDTRKKVYWFGSGLIVLLEGAWHSVKDFFIK